MHCDAPCIVAWPLEIKGQDCKDNTGTKVLALHEADLLDLIPGPCMVIEPSPAIKDKEMKLETPGTALAVLCILTPMCWLLFQG